MIEKKRVHLKTLTFFRYCAAFWVFSYHCMAKVEQSTGIDPFSGNSILKGIIGRGYAGVSFFFILSGFILCYTYVKPDGGMMGGFRQFVAARVARIVPVYWLSLVVFLPISIGLIFVHLDGFYQCLHYLFECVLNFLLLQAWYPPAIAIINLPGWSLSAEAFFYTVFLVGAAAIARRVANLHAWLIVAMTLIVILFGLVVSGAFYALTNGTFGNENSELTRYQMFLLMGAKFNPLFHVGEFFVGFLTGILFLRSQLNGLKLSLNVARLLLVVILVALFLFLVIVDIPLLYLHNGMLSIFFAPLIFLVARMDFVAPQVVTVPWKVAILLGNASYALYLFHNQLIRYMTEFFWSILGRSFSVIQFYGIMLLIGGIFISLLSIAIYIWIEEPSRVYLRRKLIGSRAAAPVDAGC